MKSSELRLQQEGAIEVQRRRISVRTRTIKQVCRRHVAAAYKLTLEGFMLVLQFNLLLKGFLLFRSLSMYISPIIITVSA